jgi:hypothetical protein
MSCFNLHCGNCQALVCLGRHTCLTNNQCCEGILFAGWKQRVGVLVTLTWVDSFCWNRHKNWQELNHRTMVSLDLEPWKTFMKWGYDQCFLFQIFEVGRFVTNCECFYVKVIFSFLGGKWV